MYSNNSALKIVQIRRAKIGDPKFLPKHDLSKMGGSKKSINQILSDPKLAESVLKLSKPKILRLNGIKLHQALAEYVLTPEQLKLHNFPIPSPQSKKIVEINDMSRFALIYFGLLKIFG